jgi:hypothetical protein
MSYKPREAKPRRHKPWIRAHRMMGWPAPNEWVWVWGCPLGGHPLYSPWTASESTWEEARDALEYHYLLQHPEKLL